MAAPSGELEEMLARAKEEMEKGPNVVYSLLHEAVDLVFQAVNDIKASIGGRTPSIRAACANAWLSISKATDALLAAYGLGVPKTSKERMERLWSLAENSHIIEAFNLPERFAALEKILMLDGFYDGVLSYRVVKKQVSKVIRYVSDVVAIILSSVEEGKMR